MEGLATTNEARRAERRARKMGGKGAGKAGWGGGGGHAERRAGEGWGGGEGASSGKAGQRKKRGGTPGGGQERGRGRKEFRNKIHKVWGRQPATFNDHCYHHHGHHFISSNIRHFETILRPNLRALSVSAQPRQVVPIPAVSSTPSRHLTGASFRRSYCN